MIYILKNTENNIVLELTNLTTILNPNYLFEFINESNINQPYRYFTTDDISAYPCRYNEFILTESDAGSDGNGNDVDINFDNGQYKYNVYATSSIIDVDNVASIISNDPISTGRMVVSGIDETVDPVYDTNIPDNTIDDTYL